MPLVLGLSPPAALRAADPARVVGLLIQPALLRSIRQKRLDRAVAASSAAAAAARAAIGAARDAADYSSAEYIAGEIRAARARYAEHGWPELDVSGRAVEETASIIVELVEQRGVDLLGAGGGGEACEIPRA